MSILTIPFEMKHGQIVMHLPTEHRFETVDQAKEFATNQVDLLINKFADLVVHDQPIEDLMFVEGQFVRVIGVKTKRAFSNMEQHVVGFVISE